MPGYMLDFTWRVFRGAWPQTLASSQILRLLFTHPPSRIFGWRLLDDVGLPFLWLQMHLHYKYVYTIYLLRIQL